MLFSVLFVCLFSVIMLRDESNNHLGGHFRYKCPNFVCSGWPGVLLVRLFVFSKLCCSSLILELYTPAILLRNKTRTSKKSANI